MPLRHCFFNFSVHWTHLECLAKTPGVPEAIVLRWAREGVFPAHAQATVIRSVKIIQTGAHGCLQPAHGRQQLMLARPPSRPITETTRALAATGQSCCFCSGPRLPHPPCSPLPFLNPGGRLDHRDTMSPGQRVPMGSAETAGSSPGGVGDLPSYARARRNMEASVHYDERDV